MQSFSGGAAIQQIEILDSAGIAAMKVLSLAASRKSLPILSETTCWIQARGKK